MEILIGIVIVVLIPIIFIGMVKNQSQRKYKHNPREWDVLFP